MSTIPRSIDKLLSDLSLEGPSNVTKMDYLTTYDRQVVRKIHREGVRMNTTALRRENHIKTKIQKQKEQI